MANFATTRSNYLGQVWSGQTKLVGGLTKLVLARGWNVFRGRNSNRLCQINNMSAPPLTVIDPSRASSSGFQALKDVSRSARSCLGANMHHEYPRGTGLLTSEPVLFHFFFLARDFVRVPQLLISLRVRGSQIGVSGSVRSDARLRAIGV